MSHLIDVDALMRRVAEHLDLGIDQVKTHFSLPEQIKMLCDELDDVNQEYVEIIQRYKTMDFRYNQMEHNMKLMEEQIYKLTSGKPTWMNKK